jgi:hypothetical protein
MGCSFFLALIKGLLAEETNDSSEPRILETPSVGAGAG